MRNRATGARFDIEEGEEGSVSERGKTCVNTKACGGRGSFFAETGGVHQSFVKFALAVRNRMGLHGGKNEWC